MLTRTLKARKEARMNKTIKESNKKWFVFFLLMFLLGSVSVKVYGQEIIPWLQKIQNQKYPFIGVYNWYPGFGYNLQLQEEVMQTYLRMGFTGSYCYGPRGGQLFRQEGYFGWMGTMEWSCPDPVLDVNGNKALKLPCLHGCFSSEKNIEAGVNHIIRQIRENREAVFQIDGISVLSSWDETGLAYKVLCRCPLCTKSFCNYLQKIYENNLNHCNDELKTKYQSWEEIELPQFNERFENPMLWKIYLDWNGWKTFDFFRQIEKKVNEKGEPFAFMTFPHSTQFWPGAAHIEGLNVKYHAEQSPFIVDEFCIADFPISSIAKSWTDRLSREYQKPILRFAWFWLGGRDSTRDYFFQPSEEINRAFGRIIGHTTHGIVFWLYMIDRIHYEKEISQEIAYWQNFLQKHWEWLKTSPTVKEDIAVLWPGYSAYFYEWWGYPKQDFGWGPQALLEEHFPFTVIQEEEIEKGILKNYKVLYLFSIERTSPKVIEEIKKFIERGGYVFATGDSLLMDISGKRTSILEDQFGILLQKKYKSTFHPTILSSRDEEWVRILQSSPETNLPPLTQTPTPTGLEQFVLDKNTLHYMDFDQHVATPGRMRTHHDICTGSRKKGEILAKFNNEVAGIETDKTIWFGHRPGFDIYAVYPEDVLEFWGEPLYPYFRTSISSARDRENYRRIITCIAHKAGVLPPVSVSYKNEVASHIEVIVRENPESGAVMAFLINHEDIKGNHEIAIHRAFRNWTVWDVTRNCLIETDTDGKFSIDIEPLITRVIFVGTRNEVKKIARAQKELQAMDLMPKPFTVGTKVLEENPIPKVKLSCQPRVENLGESEIARISVIVKNPCNIPRVAEPIVIPVKNIIYHLDASQVKSVLIKNGPPVQLDDCDSIKGFSKGDEIVFQTDLAPSETRNYELLLLTIDNLKEDDKSFCVEKNGNGILVFKNSSPFYHATPENSWEFPTAWQTSGSERRENRDFGKNWLQPGAKFAVKKKIENKEMAILADGPVRKHFRIVHTYKDIPVQTYVTYAVYRNSPRDEFRVYASIEHRINGDINITDNPDCGHLVIFDPGNLPGTYIDTLGRVGPFAGRQDFMSANLEKNFGGWANIPYGRKILPGKQQSVPLSLTILVQRTKGVLQPVSVPDEQDGIQVFGSTLARAARSINIPDLRKGFDSEILAGNCWKLQTLLILSERGDNYFCSQNRALFSNPLIIEITDLKVRRVGK